MAFTPATRVSQTLHKGGLPTTLSSDRAQGNKVRNQTTPGHLRHVRFSGRATVSVTADFDSPSLVAQRLDEIQEILTAAGYRVERSPIPGSRSLNVWEPNWRSYLDPRQAALQAEPAPVEWRADKLRDGRVLVHDTTCPATPPGKSMPVRGRTLDAVAAEVNGKLIRKSATAPVQLIELHDCTSSQGGPAA